MNGEPISDAELAVIVVDEAILALTNYQMVDPISVFYAERGSGVMSVYGHNSIILANPQILATDQNRMMDGSSGALLPQTVMEAAMAPSAEASKAEGSQPTSISVRSDFNPLATFAPTVRTGSNGEARASVQLPDNLTRYRRDGGCCG